MKVLLPDIAALVSLALLVAAIGAWAAIFTPGF